jgi:hypothetical protein
MEPGTFSHIFFQGPGDFFNRVQRDGAKKFQGQMDLPWRNPFDLGRDLLKFFDIKSNLLFDDLR